MEDAQLFIRTHLRDLSWLKASLRSVKKYWSSTWNPVIVATPDCAGKMPQPETRDLGCALFYETPLEDQRRGSELLGLNADQYCASSVILITDSDCLFKRSAWTRDFFDGPRIVIRGEPWETVRDPVNQICLDTYRIVIREWLGIEPTHECMRHHPFVFFKEDFALCRRAIETRLGTSLLEASLRVPSGLWSEFNLLSAYCLTKPERYVLKSGLLWEEQFVRQFHSWTQSPRTQIEEVSQILGQGAYNEVNA
jgi:hypothetical protein